MKYTSHLILVFPIGNHHSIELRKGEILRCMSLHVLVYLSECSFLSDLILTTTKNLQNDNVSLRSPMSIPKSYFP